MDFFERSGQHHHRDHGSINRCQDLLVRDIDWDEIIFIGLIILVFLVAIWVLR